MIDRELRRNLGELIRKLAAGMLRTGIFEQQADALVAACNDRSLRAIIAEIREWYPEDILDFRPSWTRRLRGHHRMSGELRRRAAIACLFLDSNREYEWPEFDPLYVRGDLLSLIGCALAASLSLTVVLAPITIPLAIWLYVRSQRTWLREWDAWAMRQNRFGDFDCWPFLRRGDFDEQRRRPRLLAAVRS